MAHHAYHIVGNEQEGIRAAHAYALAEGIPAHALHLHTHGLFSVDDARLLIDRAHRTEQGGQLLLVLSVQRIFHEAQNAMLKLFEEPPEGVTLILVVPAEGLLLPTLRSRLMPLPRPQGATDSMPEIAAQFLASTAPERAKMVEKLVARTKSDKDEEKQRGRSEAVILMEGLMRHSYQALDSARVPAERVQHYAVLSDLSRFLPILHERSAPIKLIFEHVLLTIPSPRAGPNERI